MGVGGGEAAAAVAVGEEGKEEGKGWRAKSKLSAAVGVALALSGVLVLHRSLRHNALVKAEEGIVCMCEERARMLQDQFAVSVNHVHALAILVATFHYEKQPPALDQVRPSLPPSLPYLPPLPSIHACLPSPRRTASAVATASSAPPQRVRGRHALAQMLARLLALRPELLACLASEPALAGSCLLPLPVPSITMIP